MRVIARSQKTDIWRIFASLHVIHLVSLNVRSNILKCVPTLGKSEFKATHLQRFFEMQLCATQSVVKL